MYFYNQNFIHALVEKFRVCLNKTLVLKQCRDYRKMFDCVTSNMSN